MATIRLVSLVVLVAKVVDFTTLVEVAFKAGVGDFTLVEVGDAVTAAGVLTLPPLHADNSKIPARLKQSRTSKDLCILWARWF